MINKSMDALVWLHKSALGSLEIPGAPQRSGMPGGNLCEKDRRAHRRCRSFGGGAGAPRNGRRPSIGMATGPAPCHRRSASARFRR